MKKVAVIYTSMTGNTEEIAEILASHLQEFAVDKIEMDEVKIEELPKYDGILIGTFSEGDGDLPMDSEELHDDLDKVDLTGIAAGCFGSGDSIYDRFGGAIDQFQEKVLEKGMNAVETPLKIDLAPDEPEDLEACKKFAEAFSKKINDA